MSSNADIYIYIYIFIREQNVGLVEGSENPSDGGSVVNMIGYRMC